MGVLIADKWGIKLDFNEKASGFFKVHLPNEIYGQPVYLISKTQDAEHKKFIRSCKPMSEEWKRSLSESEWSTYSRRNPEYLRQNYPAAWKFQQILLEFGGEDTCLQLEKEGLKDIDRLLLDGQLWLGKNAKMERGFPGRCHSNSAKYYEQNKDLFDIRICIGYALSKDGMWREHSWLIQHNPRSNQVVETTKFHVLYYGRVLSPEDCQAVCKKWLL